jgi:hypothetical protein
MESEKKNVQIIELLAKVMEDVGAVRKAERNQAQNFNFRGIDAVVNAVSPALRAHGVVVTPEIVSCDYTTVEIGKNRTAMGHCRVTVTYKFYAPDGSYLPTTVCAESMDSGDKATAKAMSVAFRTCLLQTLCLPTDDTDPDHEVYQRSGGQTDNRTIAPSAPKAKAEVATPELPGASVTAEYLAKFEKACFEANLAPIQVCAAAGLDLDDLRNDDKAKLQATFKLMKQGMIDSGELKADD